jgi:hypothetical protein
MGFGVLLALLLGLWGCGSKGGNASPATLDAVPGTWEGRAASPGADSNRIMYELEMRKDNTFILSMPNAKDGGGSKGSSLRGAWRADGRVFSLTSDSQARSNDPMKLSLSDDGKTLSLVKTGDQDPDAVFTKRT